MALGAIGDHDTTVAVPLNNEFGSTSESLEGGPFTRNGFENVNSVDPHGPGCILRFLFHLVTFLFRERFSFCIRYGSNCSELASRQGVELTATRKPCELSLQSGSLPQRLAERLYS